MIMVITTELPILNVSRYIYHAKPQMTFDEFNNLEDDETEVYQSASDEIWVSYRSDETGIRYSAVYKKSKSNYWNIAELTSREYIDESDYYE